MVVTHPVLHKYFQVGYLEALAINKNVISYSTRRRWISHLLSEGQVMFFPMLPLVMIKIISTVI